RADGTEGERRGENSVVRVARETARVGGRHGEVLSSRGLQNGKASTDVPKFLFLFCPYATIGFSNRRRRRWTGSDWTSKRGWCFLAAGSWRWFRPWREGAPPVQDGSFAIAFSRALNIWLGRNGFWRKPSGSARLARSTVAVSRSPERKTVRM